MNRVNLDNLNSETIVPLPVYEYINLSAIKYNTETARKSGMVIFGPLLILSIRRRNKE